MARKICTAGVVGEYSFMVLNDGDSTAVARVRSADGEFVTRHIDVNHGTEWAERKIKELNGKVYEAD